MKPALISSLVLLLSLFSSIPFFSSAVRCHPEEREILLEIKKAFNDPYVLASWNPDIQIDCCYWYCLKCDRKTNHVVALTIFAGSVSGEIPSAIGKLQYLTTLMLKKQANLTGEISSAILNLKNLQSLELTWTNLTGEIPRWLDQLSNLTSLDLSFNRLTGSIPENLANLKNLNSLHLDRNRLTGKIPESFGRFKGNVPYLYLSHNNLSGEIPKSLSDVDFPHIDLSRNKLVGDASQIFGRNKSTNYVDLSRNLLEFDFSKVEFPENLQNLDLNHNMIFGGIPAQISNLTNLQFFNVSYNRLCGEIPQGQAMARFDNSSYLHNKCLCGPPLSPCK